MPRTANQIAETHMVARARQQAGRPVWDEVVRLGDVWRDEDLSFEERRDAIVARLRTTRWFAQSDPDEFDGVHEIIAYHLAEAEDADEFNGWWDDLYDHADLGEHRVFIDTIS